MSCVFPNVIDSLTGSDANYELVTSSTITPLKLVWTGATKLRVFIFYHSELEGFFVWISKGKSAQIIAEEAKADFIATFESLGEEVEVIILPNYTKT